MASHYRDHGPLDCKVYVGDLGGGAAKHEIEQAFSKYGTITNVWIARNPPGFAFVEFMDSRDAYDSARGMDGKYLCGRRVRCELSNGKSRRPRGRDLEARPRSGGGGGGGSYGRYGRSSKHSRSRSRSRSPRRYRSRSKSPRRRSPVYKRSKSGSRDQSRDKSRDRSRERPRSRSRSPRPRTRSRSPRPRSRSRSPRPRSRSRSPRPRSRSRSPRPRSRSRSPRYEKSHSRSRSHSRTPSESKDRHSHNGDASPVHKQEAEGGD